MVWISGPHYVGAGTFLIQPISDITNDVIINNSENINEQFLPGGTDILLSYILDTI